MLIIPLTKKISWRNPPIITISIILFNCLVFFLLQSGDTQKHFEASEYYFTSGLARIEVPRYIAYRQGRLQEIHDSNDENIGEDTLIRFYLEMERDFSFLSIGMMELLKLPLKKFITVDFCRGFIYGSLVTGYWLLVAGCWSLGTGYWILDTGYSILVTGCWSLVTGHWILDTRYWILDTGCSVSRRHKAQGIKERHKAKAGLLFSDFCPLSLSSVIRHLSSVICPLSSVLCPLTVGTRFAD
jgi:hypothetical protein